MNAGGIMNIQRSMLVVVSAFFLALLLMPPVVHSYDRGDELLWACNAAPDSSIDDRLAQIHCMGYVQGILDGVQLIFGLQPESKFFCPPESGISNDQGLRIVIKWLENNPEKLHESARMAVLIAYAQAFPCN